jgi:hypothetical protein
MQMPCWNRASISCRFLVFPRCLVEPVLIIEYGPDIKSQIENGLAKSDFAIAQLLYFNNHKKGQKTQVNTRSKTSRPLWNGFSSGIFNSNLFFRRVLLNVELVSNCLSLDSYKLHRLASLNTTHPVLPRCVSTTWVTNSAKTIWLIFEQCFICEKQASRSELREVMTMQLNTRLHQCAQNLQDQKLLATLSAGDVVAQELKL